ncbi:MAG: hypothetical protein GDA40_11280 [Rhodobacteraceae bacterium]|nr:hypothetical protein [Paracoccaceae bacterium]
MTEKEEILELYKVMVGTITAAEARRQRVNAVFTTLMVAVFGAAGVIDNFDFLYASIFAIILSLLWFAQLVYFKWLAEAKFCVIDQLEQRLSYKPFQVEWSHMQSRLWKIPLTRLELFVPLLFLLSSLAYAFVCIKQIFCLDS